LRLLRSLGIDVSDFGVLHHRIDGNLICWSSEKLEAVDFLNDPDGPGWRLDRTRFDESLRMAAVSAGARRFKSSIDALARNGEIWQLRTSRETIESAWLIDATGHNSSVARMLGVRRIRDEGLVALYVFAEADQTLDRTLIEAVPEGWWYGASILRGLSNLVLHVRPEQARAFRQNWFNALECTLFVRKYFPPSKFDQPPAIIDATGGCLQTFHGPHWIACGDAAMSFDPLSSQGVYNAMYSGIMAARAVILSERDASALSAYSARLDTIRNVYRARLLLNYGLVGRWPTEPFWCDRSPTGAARTQSG
jgi:flavin-dependent dehydrogenase